ncbi:hypothetical protein BKA70DRAFT_1534526 [Coprinopsis sp. MPI-PUGE-AT-0042]|nr:hypothetical protein BKA70DRAFT_1534526 [Coprinopsis sp. MPI-PUGE-AT-0042]
MQATPLRIPEREIRTPPLLDAAVSDGDAPIALRKTTRTRRKPARLLDNTSMTSADFEAADLLPEPLAPFDGALDSDDGYNDGDPWFDDANWISTPISIAVPFHKFMKNSGIQKRLVGTLQHRKLISVVEEKIRNAPIGSFHYQPYKVFWVPPNEAEQQNIRVQGELYNSPAFMEAHQRLQDSPPAQGCSLERVVVALMFWSDETHLSAFGAAKIWPCYLFFGNESKYRRSKTSLRLCEHIAYFDSLSDDFKDYLRERNGGKAPPKDLITHCAREMFHAQWDVLLGDHELLDAMKHGIVIVCLDGVPRRFFPTVFTYSADYPEKARVALIKQNGNCPCAGCLVQKQQVANMGTPDDMILRVSSARRDDEENHKMILQALKYVQAGYAVTGKTVDTHLKSRSLLPIKNAFREHLGSFGFDVYQSLVVDVLHEFEIGVWKTTYIHLLRLLEATGGQDLLSELDERSLLLVVTQYESLTRTLQTARGEPPEIMKISCRRCSIAVFEGLLPSPHNEIVMDLLFLLCDWHALAKMRMHHEGTLDLLESATINLGSQFRKFQTETCQQVKTVELQREAQARARRNAAKQTSGPRSKSSPDHNPEADASGDPEANTPNNPEADTSSTPSANRPASSPSSRRPKKFSLSTPKYHSLGHYAANIRRYGTTDSYTSEIGETNHPAIKSWYKRTDRRNYPAQIAKIARRRARFRRLKARLSSEEPTLDSDDCTPGFVAPTTVQYYIGQSKKHLDLNAAFTNSQGSGCDPLLNSFIPKLKRHLFPRIRRLLAPDLCFRTSVAALDEQYTEEECAGVTLHNNKVFTHQIMNVKYTTYDVRREEDIVHLKARPSVMVLDNNYTSASNAYPYRYARVLGIFHADVRLIGDLPDGRRDYTPHRVDFLWVRWYELCTPPGNLKLERLQFVPLKKSESVGFLDPRQVIRSVHLIPQFACGKQLGPRLSVWLETPLWKFYYLNRFVDRDMFMRYHWRLAIGHAAIQHRYQHTDQASVLAPSNEGGHPSISFPPLEPELLDSRDGDGSSSESDSDLEARWDDAFSDTRTHKASAGAERSLDYQNRAYSRRRLAAGLDRFGNTLLIGVGLFAAGFARLVSSWHTPLAPFSSSLKRLSSISSSNRITRLNVFSLRCSVQGETVQSAHQPFDANHGGGLHVRSGLLAVVFHKPLRTSGKVRSEHNAGQITPMVSTDATCLDRFATAGVGLEQLGYSSLVGSCVLILDFPLQIVPMTAVFKQGAKTVMFTNNRIRLTAEASQSVRLTKFFGWEPFYAQQMVELRKGEIHALQPTAHDLIGDLYPNPGSYSLIRRLFRRGAFHCLISEHHLSGHLYAHKPRTEHCHYLQLSPALQYHPHTTHLLPFVLASLSDALDAICRIEDLPKPYEVFNANELAANADGDFAWETVGVPDHGSGAKKGSKEKAAKKAAAAEKKASKEELPMHMDEKAAGNDASSENVAGGSFMGIVGRVGSSKSSVLQALIGEMMTWIRNATLRENILFGPEDDPERFDEVVHACGLEHDIETLPEGDQTEIGEKRTNLSGGQKARVSLARAAYPKPDIVLLDDPLSAVDANVGKKITNDCLLNGPSPSALVCLSPIRCTRSLHVLDKLDYVYVMDQGETIEHGTYGDLMANSIVFSRIALPSNTSPANTAFKTAKTAHDFLTEVTPDRRATIQQWPRFHKEVVEADDPVSRSPTSSSGSSSSGSTEATSVESNNGIPADNSTAPSKLKKKQSNKDANSHFVARHHRIPPAPLILGYHIPGTPSLIWGESLFHLYRVNKYPGVHGVISWSSSSKLSLWLKGCETQCGPSSGKSDDGEGKTRMDEATRRKIFKGVEADKRIARDELQRAETERKPRLVKEDSRGEVWKWEYENKWGEEWVKASWISNVAPLASYPPLSSSTAEPTAQKAAVKDSLPRPPPALHNRIPFHRLPKNLIVHDLWGLVNADREALGRAVKQGIEEGGSLWPEPLTKKRDFEEIDDDGKDEEENKANGEETGGKIDGGGGKGVGMMEDRADEAVENTMDVEEGRKERESIEEGETEGTCSDKPMLDVNDDVNSNDDIKTGLQPLVDNVRLYRLSLSPAGQDKVEFEREALERTKNEIRALVERFRKSSRTQTIKALVDYFDVLDGSEDMGYVATLSSDGGAMNVRRVEKIPKSQNGIFWSWNEPPVGGR